MSLITYEDFIEKAKAARARQKEQPVPEGCEDAWVLKMRQRDDVFMAEWVSGGEEGHNCWSWAGMGDPDFPERVPQDVKPDRVPDIWELAPVLSDLGIPDDGDTYVIDWDYVGGSVPAWEVRGEYGNHVKYGVRWIEFERLYEALVEIGKAEPKMGAPTP